MRFDTINCLPIMRDRTKKRRMSSGPDQSQNCTAMEPEKKQVKRETPAGPKILVPLIQSCFSKILSRTHFFPTVTELNKEQCGRGQEEIAGSNVDIPQPLNVEIAQPLNVEIAENESGGDASAAQETQVRSNKTQQRIRHCLKQLSEKTGEVMLVTSQIDVTDYLGDSNFAATDVSSFPTPVDFKQENKHQGDFDFLIIHKTYGLIVAEVRHVGDTIELFTKEERCERIIERVQLASRQLMKAESVLGRIVSDMPNKPQISKFLILPDLSQRDLWTSIRKDSQTIEEARMCFNLPKGTDPTDFIMCADQLPDGDACPDVTKLTEWWKRLTLHIGVDQDPSVAENLYLELAARFGGPATRFPVCSDIRSSPIPHYIEGGAVSEARERFTRPELHPEPVQVAAEPCAFLCGPPGTGKTLTLHRRARDWLTREFRDFPLDIVSTWSGSMAASHRIRHQLMLDGFSRKRVRMHHFDLKEPGQVDYAVGVLLRKAQDGRLLVIADEAFCGSEFAEFYDKLDNNVILSLWAASVYHGFRPERMPLKTFLRPRRTPAVITREVGKSCYIKEGFVHEYPQDDVQSPTEGSSVTTIQHRGKNHARGWAGQCGKCGLELADYIINQLHIGQLHPTPATSSEPATSLLNFQDIFLLTSTYELEDEERDEDGCVRTPRCALLEGLQQRGVPFRVVKRGDYEALREVAEGSGPDAVVVADADSIRGLEKKVVMWVPYDDDGISSGEIDFARLDAMSRATKHLVLISP